ncbi:MAG: hypothetical protein V3U27_00070 [Candidatus Tectomicrobia bacterium]
MVEQNEQQSRIERMSWEEAKKLMHMSRLDPEEYETFIREIKELDDHGTFHVRLRVGERPATIKRRLERIGESISVPVTARKTATGLMVWKKPPEEHSPVTARGAYVKR